MSSQSPIHIVPSQALLLAHPQVLFECRYNPETEVSGCFEGDAGEANFIVQSGSAVIAFRGDEYELKKIHVHSGSEHTIEHDNPHDMELHFVHAPKGSAVPSPLVAVGVFFFKADQSSPNSLAEKTAVQFVESMRSGQCTTIHPWALLPQTANGGPDTSSWFHYEGSLTSFPYSENVSWIVLKSSADLGGAAIDALTNYSTQPVRPMQPLNRRIVVRSF